MSNLFKSHISQTEQVWLVLHFIELVTTVMAVYYHLYGILENHTEPLTHDMFCCGISMTFLIYCFLDIVRILTGGYASFLFMMLVELFAAASFYIISIISMYYLEKDFHLQYLDKMQEDLHPFFSHNKYQSCASLASATFHLLHGCLLADAFMTLGEKASKTRNVGRFGDFRAKSLRMSTVSQAQNPLNIAVCHEKFAVLTWIQKKWEKLFTRRTKSVIVLSKRYRPSYQKSTASTTSGSVRFTMGYV